MCANLELSEIVYADPHTQINSVRWSGNFSETLIPLPWREVLESEVSTNEEKLSNTIRVKEEVSINELNLPNVISEDSEVVSKGEFLSSGFSVKGEASINKVILSNVISEDSEVLFKEGFLSNGISVKGEASINKVILSNVNSEDGELLSNKENSSNVTRDNLHTCLGQMHQCAEGLCWKIIIQQWKKEVHETL